MATPAATSPSSLPSSLPAPCSSVVFLITGASRGLGRAIATVAAKYYHRASDGDDAHRHRPNAKFVLVARSAEGLEATKQEIIAMDLSDLDRLDANADLLLEDVDRLLRASKRDDNDDNHNHNQQQRVIFVNNAGSLGHLGPCVTSPSLEDMRQTIDFNVTSSLWLSVRFARHIQEQQKQQQQQQQQPQPQGVTAATIVHVSSLVAISDDFLSMGIYSAGKAARERYHTMMAREDRGRVPLALTPTLTPTILNYAPGPLETDMTTQIRGADELDAGLKEQFRRTMEDPNDSALKLVRLLEEKDYYDWKSGAHIDYYDLPANEVPN
eukprot:jgi/Psemu1/256858/estExt_Genewise1Plus.C_1980062